jgi:RNA polymerase sigma factor (sigma-70 family)
MAVRRVRGFSLTALKAGDARAWSWVVAEYRGKVTGYAARMGARDPDEVAGATLEALARRIGDFEGTESQFRSFVFSIAHARIVDDLRRATRRSEVSIENTLTLLAADEPDEDTFSDPDLLAALDRLPEEQRRMLELRYVVGLSTKETADAIGKSEVATRVALSRAFTRLKGILRSELGMTGPESAIGHDIDSDEGVPS